VPNPLRLDRHWATLKLQAENVTSTIYFTWGKLSWWRSCFGIHVSLIISFSGLLHTS